MVEARTEQLPGGASDDGTVQLFRLVAVDGSGQWRAKGGRLTVGSHEGNDVVLLDSTVSRYHCELAVADGGVWVTDLQSRNGTLVNGVRVTGARLEHKATLRLGRVALRYERLGERESLDVGQRSFGPLVGGSLAMRAVFAALERAARTDASVLLEGETGTGKGAIVEALHAASARSDGPLVVVDCGSLAPGVLDSELFGAARASAFEDAAGGTLFFDEIGELPLDLQPRLLRALESRTVRRAGASAPVPVDVRVVAATNRDLRGLVNAGRFRSDLYYRLAVVRVRVPPLRERTTDIAELVAALLASLRASPEQVARLTSAELLQRLEASTWPGNVRELRNYLERSLVLEAPPPVEDIAVDASFSAARRRALDAFERSYLEDILRRHHGKVAAAARAAGVARVYVYRLMSKYGIKPGVD